MTENQNIHLWVDDERPMQGHFNHHAKTAQEAVTVLNTGKVTILSLDHDLGPPEAGTGYDVACHVEGMCHEGLTIPHTITLHTANPVGRKRMEGCLDSIRRMQERSPL